MRHELAEEEGSLEALAHQCFMTTLMVSAQQNQRRDQLKLCGQGREASSFLNRIFGSQYQLYQSPQDRTQT